MSFKNYYFVGTIKIVKENPAMLSYAKNKYVESDATGYEIGIIRRMKVILIKSPVIHENVGKDGELNKRRMTNSFGGNCGI